MTRLTDIARHVAEPAAGDRLYIVDVSDLSEGPAGSSGYTTPADILRNAQMSFETRAEAAASLVPPATTHISAGGCAFVADPTGTALTTADGRNWSPDAFATYEHWGAVGDGVTDDTAAIRACHDWCMGSAVPVRPLGRRYRVTGTIVDYDVARDGINKRLHLQGSGTEQTMFLVNTNLSDFLFKVSGDRSFYGAPRAGHWMFRDFSILSNGQVDCDLFQLQVCNHTHIINVSAYNVRGHCIWAREWWDSMCEGIFIRCGDDGAGTGPGTRQKEVVNLSYLHGGADLTNSGTNNIDFGPQFHIAASRWIAHYWGPATRQNLFEGKVHGIIGAPIAVPHFVLDGAGRNSFMGATLTQCGDVCVEIRNDSNYVPFQNVFIGCRFDSLGEACVRLNAVSRHVFVGNVFTNASCGVWLQSGGSGNIIHSNAINGGGVEMRIDAPTAMRAVEFPADLILSRPGAVLRIASPNGTLHDLTVTNTGILQLDGSSV